MTGPAPRFDRRWDDPAHSALDTARVLPWTGRFEDDDLERAFRRHVWPEWSSRLRVVGLLAALLSLSFGFTDWLALGFGTPLYVCWGLRIAVLLGTIGVGRLTLGDVRPQRLDNAVFALLVLFSAALFVVVALQQKSIMLETPGVLLMVLGFYLFVPARFEIQLACAVFVSLGFAVVAMTLLGGGVEDRVTSLLEILICNVLGAFTALRTHRLQRREYLRLRQVRQRARFEELVAKLSTRFVMAPSEGVDRRIDVIDEALAEIGEFAGADRTYVFNFDTARRLASCSHEWCRPGIAPAMVTLQQVPFDAFAWATDELLQGRTLRADRLSDLPPEGAAVAAEAARHGARSLLVLPLVFGERVLGAIGFNAVAREMQWDHHRIAVLRIVGEMIIGVLVRRRGREELEAQARALASSVAALEKSNTELQHFAHVAAHDLQEPLRSISSFSSLLGERYRARLDAKADEYIGYLTAAARRMHDLIGSLTAYSRLDLRSRPFVRCPLHTMVNQALANLAASIEESGAEVTVSGLPVVDGDPSQLVQLFQNLIGNAVKFVGASQKPRVTVSARPAMTGWEVSIADNGIGIEPQHAERIFQAFTRLHTLDQYPGTGMGLAVCRRIVERHHGRIWVEPNAPRGSVFRFTLRDAP